MRYFVSAGEASGDLHAADLMVEIQKLDPEADFVFLGGENMERAAGHAPVIDIRRMAFMGFSEVLRNLRTITGNFKRAKDAMHECEPDAVILVDYPGFNLKLAKEANAMGVKVFYYISPKVWAWKKWRVKDLRKYVTKILSILPFEKEWFAREGMDVEYVGNPSVDEITVRQAAMKSRAEVFGELGLDVDRPLLVLVPGSRRGEVRNNLPIMAEVARRHRELQVVVAGAPGLDREHYPEDLTVVFGKTPELMRYADAALVTSGTATLECALSNTPQVACYRANGSRLSYNLMKLLVKIPFVTLPNLVAGKRVIPEMLVHECTVDAVDAELGKLLTDEGRKEQMRGYELMREKLGERKAAESAARYIIENTLER